MSVGVRYRLMMLVMLLAISVGMIGSMADESPRRRACFTCQGEMVLRCMRCGLRTVVCCERSKNMMEG